MAGTLPNFIGGRWETPAAETAQVHDPATQALLARVPLCGPAEVDALLDHPDVRAVSFVGSTPVARHADSLEAAIGLVNRGAYGNMACLFTESGAAARRFRHEVEAGNVGINIGVAAAMALFPFSGWKESFFGDLHAQGSHALEFYTQTKVVVERWPREWSRTF